MEIDAVVLAGGSGHRMGGVDKAALVVGGRTLLDGVLAASARARATVVVGPERPAARPVTWTTERPPGGGPLAGVVAGLRALPEPAADAVLLLAVDLPRLRAPDVDRLVGALMDTGADTDAAVFVDGGGRLQPLAGLYRREPLRAALADLGDAAGRPMRLLGERLRISGVPDAGAAEDCDTPDQLNHQHQLHRSRLEGDADG